MALANATAQIALIPESANRLSPRGVISDGFSGKFAQVLTSRVPKDRLREQGAAAAELRLGLQRDIETARVEAKEIVSEIHRSHTRAALIRWGAAGVVSAAALFGASL